MVKVTISDLDKLSKLKKEYGGFANYFNKNRICKENKDIDVEDALDNMALLDDTLVVKFPQIVKSIDHKDYYHKDMNVYEFLDSIVDNHLNIEGEDLTLHMISNGIEFTPIPNI